MTSIIELLNRKKLGIDCSEDESAEIKGYIKSTILVAGDGSVELDAELQLHFPLEWAEAQDELITCPVCRKDNTRPDFDFPDTMRCCDSCGADYIGATGEIILDPRNI
jgi:hypothetical protein